MSNIHATTTDIHWLVASNKNHMEEVEATLSCIGSRGGMYKSCDFQRVVPRRDA